jgi:carbonic anhydrase
MRTTRLMVITLGWTLGWALLAAIGMAAGTDTSAMSPAQALARLMTGNQRFQKNKLRHPDLDPTRREKLVGGQSPFAAILSCSDSRVPPELIFDQGLGDLFEVRLAGNTVTRAGLESIDYAVSHLGTRLIMVLGHESCGAVKEALGECASKPATELPEIFANICPAVEQARKRAVTDLESSAINLNVREQVNILERSPMFRKRVSDGSLKVVGARYNLESGKVDILTGD